MARSVISLLNPSEVERIHETSLRVLREVGVLVHQAEVLDRLAGAGAKVDGDRRIARFDEDMVMGAVARRGNSTSCMAGAAPPLPASAMGTRT